MWLPTPIYKRIPQFWFLLGLLFFANGLYLGFEFTVSFWYIAVGITCCAYSAGVLAVRIRNRQVAQRVQQTASPAESALTEPDHAEPANTEPSQAD